MNEKLAKAFVRVKPYCDAVMVQPLPENIDTFMKIVPTVEDDAFVDLQQYMLFPLTTHLKSMEMETNFNLLGHLVEAMRLVCQRARINSFEMCIQSVAPLLSLIFDKPKPGMIADVPEELKLSVIKCLTELMVNVQDDVRIQLYKTQMPLVAQAVFVSVHMAKLEKLRSLRLAALECLSAFTSVHRAFLNDDEKIGNPKLLGPVMDMHAAILPGVMAALQDVATCTNNPGQAVIINALTCMHRILSVVMNSSNMPKQSDVTVRDFAKMIATKINVKMHSPEKPLKDVSRRTREWYTRTDEKVAVALRSLAPLAAHEQARVRRGLAALHARVLRDCALTMPLCVPIAIEVLVMLSKDEYPDVSSYCRITLATFFKEATPSQRLAALDDLCENFFQALNSLPRYLNNIDNDRKLAQLNLVHGYVEALCAAGRPQRLTAAVSAAGGADRLCDALLAAAATHADIALLRRRPRSEVLGPPPTKSVWCRLRHLDTPECEVRLRETCGLLGSAECASLLLDRLLDLFHQRRDCETVYIMNWMATALTANKKLATRILDAYIEEDVWYSPLEVSTSDAPLTSNDTLDPSVYNPRAWVKDSVPGLYEGATEVRYTDISYSQPRAPRTRDPRTAPSLAAAQRHAALACLLTEGVGLAARRLGEGFGPYMVKVLGLILERVASKYEMLHLAGLRAVHDMAASGGYGAPSQLIIENSDYITNQISARIKKAWSNESAMQILIVVMQFSGKSFSDDILGIMQDIVIQSCDKYYARNRYSYMQVFVTFIQCLRKWYLKDTSDEKAPKKAFNILKEVQEYIVNKKEAERLMEIDDKSAEEMYNEDARSREENAMEFDDTVTREKPPLPPHIPVALKILQRCINLITCSPRDEAVLAIQAVSLGLPLLEAHEDELLPVVHMTWGPLVATMKGGDPVLMRQSLDLLVTMCNVSKDFLRSRVVKDVFPYIYAYLRKTVSESYLKDAGSTYRKSAAFSMQLTALGALHYLAIDLRLDEDSLYPAMECVAPYLSNRQPQKATEQAVLFFRRLLKYNYGAVWYFLRRFCGNDKILETPDTTFLELEPCVGTPYESTVQEYNPSLKLIFDLY